MYFKKVFIHSVLLKIFIYYQFYIFEDIKCVIYGYMFWLDARACYAVARLFLVVAKVFWLLEHCYAVAKLL